MHVQLAYFGKINAMYTHWQTVSTCSSNMHVSVLYYVLLPVLLKKNSFLQKSLPAVTRALAENELNIDGVSPPPLCEVVCTGWSPFTIEVQSL